MTDNDKVSQHTKKQRNLNVQKRTPHASLVTVTSFSVKFERVIPEQKPNLLFTHRTVMASIRFYSLTYITIPRSWNKSNQDQKRMSNLP